VAASDLPAPIEAGRTLGGRYQLIQPIARGGMAEVWEGHDEVLSRPVAVKVLRAHLAEDGVFLERFRREAVTAARLAHPGVVSTFDTGVDHGTAYIVMELVRGCTLRQLLSEHGPLEPWLAVAITRQIADALAYAHQAGLVHRDIKPANVLLTDDEWGGLRAKVTDFGIAKAGSGLGGDLTRTGIVLGTPKYLSPEQIRGREPDARADLYSLGVVLYEMLTGVPPFVGPTDMATALAHLNDRVPRISSRTRPVPPALERLVIDLLAKDPQHRVPSAAALRQRLDACNLAPPLKEAGAGRRSGRRQRHAPPAPTPPPRLPALEGAPTMVTANIRAPSSGPAPVQTRTAVMGPLNGPALPPPAAGAGGRDPTRSARGTAANTSVMDTPASRPATDPVRRPTPRRRRRAPGLVVLGLAVAGAIVAAVLLFDPQRLGSVGSGGSPDPTPASRQITSVDSFMMRGTPDDPQGLPYTFDGNPATYWHTDQYHSATFSNLYPGLGVAIRLKGSAVLHHLVVTSTTVGWSAQTYTSESAVATGQPVTAWGSPTATHTDINGSATFSLAGRRGQWVLLWLTNLGPQFQTHINELAVN
jgi:eukaryotic-like serine/threonine-protein kinase